MSLGVPGIVYYRYKKDLEWGIIVSTLESLDLKKSPSKRGKINKFIERPIISVMEYIPGTNLYKADLNLLFGKDTLHEQGKKFLFEMGMFNIRYNTIGRILAYDVIINNWDRLPLIWDHAGNLENMLFTTNPEIPVIGIDQSVQSIHQKLHPENFNKYTNKIIKLLQEITSYSVDEGTAIGNIRNSIKTQTLYDIGEEGCKLLCKGLLSQIPIICEKLTPDVLQSLFNKFENDVNDLINTMIWGQDLASKYGITLINLDFLNNIIDIFKQFLPSIEKIKN